MRGQVSDKRTRRQKLAEMEERGSAEEAAFARAWREAHPVLILSAAEILSAKDEQYGPTAEEVDAEIDAYYRRQRSTR